MIQQITLRIPPHIAVNQALLLQESAREANIPQEKIQDLRILRRSIDARQRNIFVNVTLNLYIGEPAPALAYTPTDYPDVSGRPQAIVVGCGPGGQFAALRLIELGIRPIVLERGKDVHERRKDIALISRQHSVDSESNYCFGEGGAGAYSDGKLYTRSTKRGNVSKILNVLCQHGAPASILTDAHPHVGTDRLPPVIEVMRNTVLSHGGEVHFQTRVDALLFDENHKVCGVRAGQQEFLGPVILATGNAARDVYRFLLKQGVQQEVKGLSFGVRLEHPSTTIDRIMYHSTEGRGEFLPAAEYHLKTQVDGRGVYSFCMCPGGFVIPAASGPCQVVVNGMSPSGRNSRWSNSGMVVETRPEDLQEPSLHNAVKQALKDDNFAETHPDITPESLDSSPLRMMYLQEALEMQCWQQGGRSQTAPAQRMTDFVRRRLQPDLPVSSYTPGLASSPLHFWMPSFIVNRLQKSFVYFDQHNRRFLDNEALLIAIETRTSSPVRITRNPETLQHITVPGLYPCGEGAGYAGGIVSAAIDGERCAEALAAEYPQ